MKCGCVWDGALEGHLKRCKAHRLAYEANRMADARMAAALRSIASELDDMKDDLGGPLFSDDYGQTLRDAAIRIENL